MSRFSITAFECAISKVTDALHEATAATRALPLEVEERRDVREALRDLRHQVALLHTTARALLGEELGSD